MIHSTSSSTRPTATRGILSRLFPALLLASLPLTAQAQLYSYGNLLIAPDDIDSIQAQEGAHFGGSLAAGDFDGDGHDDLVIGTPDGDFLGPAGAGSLVVLYHFHTGGWSHRSILSQDSPQITDVSEAGDGFATALAVGDFDHDGFDDLAIGVPHENVGADTDAGAIHVIYGSATGLDTSTEDFFTRAIVEAGTVEADSQFGSVLSSGDLDNDGYDDLAIGAPFETVQGAADAGVVVIAYGGPGGISPTGAQWVSQFQLGAVNGEDSAEAGDNFGKALAIGDFDNDGYGDLAVGAPNESHSSVLTGAINIIFGTSSGLQAVDSQFTALLPEDRQFFQSFGAALAAGDFNGDGVDDLAVGAPRRDDQGVVDAGRVTYLKGLQDVGFVFEQEDDFRHVTSAFAARLGASLVGADFDGDGIADLAMGLPRRAVSGQTSAGQIAVRLGAPGFIATSSIWSQINLHGIPEAEDQFGSAMAVGSFAGNTPDLIIGVPHEAIMTVEDAGAVHVVFSSVLLFTDGFESGSTDSWSTTVP